MKRMEQKRRLSLEHGVDAEDVGVRRRVRRVKSKQQMTRDFTEKQKNIVMEWDRLDEKVSVEKLDPSLILHLVLLQKS